MDFDALPFEHIGPQSRNVADVRGAYLNLAAEGLSRVDERIGCSIEFQSNLDGHLAWDLALYMRAACLLWRVTGEKKYLTRAFDWATHLCAITDSATGALDWKGRSGPLWSAGSRYTAGAIELGFLEGRAIELQAAADRVVIERPSSTTAIVTSIRSDGSVWTSNEASLLPDTPNYLPDALSRRSSVHAVLLRGLKSPGDLTFISPGEYSVAPRRAAHLVHTGLIVRSLLQVAECMEELQGRGSSQSHELLQLARVGSNALSAHDSELIQLNESSWYATPIDFPGRRLGLEVPHNHTVDVATSYMMLGKMLDEPDLQHRGVSLTQAFLNEVSMYVSGELDQPWYYYPVNSDMFCGVSRRFPLEEREVPGLGREEDSSHALLRVRALADWRRYAPGGIADSAMRAVADTFGSRFLVRSHGGYSVRWLPVDEQGAAGRARLGMVNSYCGAWGALSPWNRLLRRRINSIAYRFPPSDIFGASVLSAAEIVAMNSR